MIKRLLPLVVFCLVEADIFTMTRANELGPSFDCARAETPDEKAICSDARLSELDRIFSRNFRLLKKKDPAQAIAQARTFMKQRKLCGNDRYCIAEQMEALLGDASKPGWLTDRFRAQLAKDVAKDDLTPRALAAVGVTGSFPTSSKGIQGTVGTIDQTDTAHAVATGIFTEPDILEYCERDPGGETIANGGKLSVRGCVLQEERALGSRRVVAQANCTAKTLTFEGEVWTAVAYSDYGLTWRGPDGEEQPASGMTSGQDGQMQLLCPNLYARLRANPRPDPGTAVSDPIPQATSDVDEAAGTVREILARDLSPVLNTNDKAGDDRKFMTPDLYRRFLDGASDFDADPYTGTQDNAGFKVDNVISVPLDPRHAVVTVAFSVEHEVARRKFAYHMVLSGGRWLIDDIDYLDDQTSMRSILAKASKQ